MHRNLFAFLEATSWWTKPYRTESDKLAKDQMHWYIDLIDLQVLDMMSQWLNRLLTIEGRSLRKPDEKNFIAFAKKHCPEEDRDRDAREERKRKFKEKFGRGRNG